jgi:DNA integrity scanning protein DisA with diadenylate cyclase activity
LATLIAIPLYYLLGKNKTTSIKIEAEERLRNELDNISLAERFLSISGELIEEKEYLLNVEKMIEEISQISPLKFEYENISKILPEEIRRGFEKEYKGKIFKMEKRNVNEIKKKIEYALKLKDLEEIRKVKDEIRILLNGLRKHIEEELNLLQELKKSVGGMKIER